MKFTVIVISRGVEGGGGGGKVLEKIPSMGRYGHNLELHII